MLPDGPIKEKKGGEGFFYLRDLVVRGQTNAQMQSKQFRFFRAGGYGGNVTF